MNKIYVFCLLCFLISCSRREYINKEILNSIYEINIQNRAAHRFGGIEEINIRDKKEIVSLYKELLSLIEENALQTKPFKGQFFYDLLKKTKMV